MWEGLLGQAMRGEVLTNRTGVSQLLLTEHLDDSNEEHHQLTPDNFPYFR